MISEIIFLHLRGVIFMGRRKRYRSVLMSLMTVLLVSNPFLGIASVLAGEKDPPATVPKTVQEPGLDVSFSQKSDSPIELEEYRTANSKRILKPNGTMTEEVYGKPIHFKDKNTNKWVSIDSTLVEENGKYKNKSNRFSVNLPKDVKGQLDFSFEGTSVSFIPIFPNSVIGKAIENKLDFTGVSADTDINYRVLPDGLKESIILKSPKAPLKYSYELKTENLTYQLNDDGSIDFFKNGEKKALLKLQAPYLEDANLKLKDAAYVIRKDSLGKTFIDVEVDSTWINDPSRAFPVVLDPSVFIQDKNQVDNTYIVEGDDFPHWNYSHLYVGKDSDLGRTRTLLWFDLPSLPSGAKIVNAELRVCNSRTWVTTQKPVVEARRITSYWDYGTVTWSNQPSIGQIDGTYQADTAYTWGFPVLGLVQAWYNGQQKNYGVELKYADENLILRELISNENATIETPCLKFDYVVDGLG
ncbi:MAG TPA: hypothetical protein DDY49_04050, partial [Paenibacillaceae bacterium]|nr:hypothetical protein [Paenibacillaceae bacterium]